MNDSDDDNRSESLLLVDVGDEDSTTNPNDPDGALDSPSRNTSDAVVVFEDEEEPDEPRCDIEIYGLRSCLNGRSCPFHAVCGSQVKAGDILRIKRVVVDISEDRTEEALSCVLVKDGVERCTVGFVPWFLFNEPMVLRNVEEHLQVTDLYAESDNTAKKLKDEKKLGVCGCIFIREVPRLE